MIQTSRAPVNDPTLSIGWKETVGYSIIVMLALAGGYCSAELVASTSNSIQPFMWPTLAVLWATLIFELPKLVFAASLFVLSLGAFHFRCTFIDPPKTVLEGGAGSFIVDRFLAAVGALAAFITAGVYFAYPLFCALFPVIACVLVVWHYAHDWNSRKLRSASVHDSEEFRTEETEFITKIFFPALSMCSLSFLLGWGLSDPSVPFLVSLVFYCIFLTGCAIVCIKRRISLPRTLLIVSSYPIACGTIYGFGFFESFPIFRYFSGPEFFFSMVWTYVMGVFEVTKRANLVWSGAISPAGATNKAIAFYEGGSNWAAVTVCHLPIALIFIVDSSSAIWFSVACIIAALAWIFFVSDKKSSTARRFSVIVGFALAGLYFLLLFGFRTFMGPLTAPTNFVPMYGILVTAIAALATIAFVLYPGEFLNVAQGLSSKGSFSERKNSVMLTMINIVVVTLLTIIWAGALNLSVGKLTDLVQKKIDIVVVISAFEMIVVFSAHLWTHARRAPEPLPEHSGQRSS